METTDLSLCEKEPIHIPGYIQPHGIAFSYDPKTLTITGVSANVPQASTLFGTSCRTLLHPAVLDFLERSHNDDTHRQLTKYGLHAFVENPACYDIVWSRSNKECLLECIPSSKIDDNDQCRFLMAESFERILPYQTLEEICAHGAQQVQKITGFDRVMIYRFDDDFNGRVIAETLREGMEPYLELNFPASDIPPQARELYRKQLVRAIVDVDYRPVAFLRMQGLEVLDMTYSHLRSVSPIHVEYLKNMQVAATLTISIVIDGLLWGLIACHHAEPHQLTLRQIEFSKAFGVIFSGMIKTRLDMASQRRNVFLISTLEAIVRGIELEQVHTGVLSTLSRHAELFHHLFESDGFALQIGDELITTHVECSHHELRFLLDHLKPKLHEGWFHTRHLQSVLPSLETRHHSQCAGILLIEVVAEIPTYWLWFRREKRQTLTWGGDPNDKMSLNEAGVISPRKSFAAFKEIVRYRSEPWEKIDLQFIDNFRAILQGLFGWFASRDQVSQKEEQIRAMEDEKILHYGELLESLVDMIEKRDAYTAGHTGRVANYCALIARQMQLPETEISKLHEAATLHDIGKVVVPDAILLKPARLSQEEFELIKTHLSAGYEILKRISYYAPLAEIMRYHHEKYNGSGYPQGLKAEEIPLLSHIMIVADAIDAMTSNRIYQARKSMDDALSEIQLYRGIWYHPDVVDAAVASLTNYHNDLSTSQIPLTPMEKARFSYYFKDQLTSTHNESYLKMITDGLIPDIFYPYFLMIEIRGMSLYNTDHGWHAGDLYIQNIGNRLRGFFPAEDIFRVFGDDFIIGAHTEKELQDYEDLFIAAHLTGLGSRSLSIHELMTLLRR